MRPTFHPRLPRTPLLTAFARPLRAAAVLALAATLACGGDDDARGDAGAEGTPAGATTTADNAGAAAAACPETGLWERCNVEKRLERAGLVATPTDSVRKEFFSIGGQEYELGRGQLQVYIYPSAAARERDTGALDRERVAPPGRTGGWSTRPRLIVSNNLAAVLLTLNETLAERVELALGAGLPE